MEIGLRLDQRRRDHSLPAWLLVLLFWAFTYILFAYRAHLRYGDDYLLLSPQRLGATLVGAGLFWLVISNLIRASGTQVAKPIAVIATILPASIVVLVARLILGQISDEVTALQSNLRWVLVWSGYFGLWISATLALHTAKLARAPNPAPAIPAIQTPVNPRRGIEISDTSMDWIIDELAAVIAAMPAARGSTILDRLERRAGYEIADPPSSQHNDRIRLVRDLALRSRRRS